jgi:hypothetical protein
MSRHIAGNTFAHTLPTSDDIERDRRDSDEGNFRMIPGQLVPFRRLPRQPKPTENRKVTGSMPVGATSEPPVSRGFSCFLEDVLEIQQALFQRGTGQAAALSTS